MLFKKGELKLLWPFYLYLFVFGLSTMIQPFFVLYFLHLGYSYFQISIIMSTSGLGVVIFEIPTGVFADGVSRRYSVILGSFITAFAAAMIAFTTNFYVVCLLFVLAGIGVTFISGAEDAWVIDNLNKEDRRDLHQEYFIKSGSFIALGSVFAPMIGALLVKNYSMQLLWIVYGFGFMFSAIIILLFTKEYFKPKKMKAMNFIKNSYHTSKMSMVFSLRHKTVFFTIIAGLFTHLMVSGSIGTQPFLVSMGMKEHQLGYLYSITAIIGIAMSFGARLLSNFKFQNTMSILILILMILLFSLLFINPPLFFIAAVIFIMKDGILRVGALIIQTYLHQFIPEKIRATTMSTKNMADQLIIAVSSMVAGACIDLFGIQKVFAFGGLFGILAILFYRKIKANGKY
jgi:MFS family permease